MVDALSRQLWPLTLTAACLQGTSRSRLPVPSLKPMTGYVGRREVLSASRWAHCVAGFTRWPRSPSHPRPTTRPSLNNPLAPESSSQAQLLGNWAPDTSLTAVGCGRLVVEAGGPGGWGSWQGPQCVEGAGLGLDPSFWDPRAWGTHWRQPQHDLPSWDLSAVCTGRLPGLDLGPWELLRPQG